jgi:hypothetical protein
VRQCLGTRAYLNYNVWALSNQRSKLTVPSYGISNLLPAYQVCCVGRVVRRVRWCVCVFVANVCVWV